MTILYEQWQQQAQQLVKLLGDDTHTVTSADALVERINTDREEILVILGPSTPLAEAVGFAQQCRLRRPALGVLLLRQHLDVSVMSEALRSGVREVVDAADHAAILAACARSKDLSRQIGNGPRVNGHVSDAVSTPGAPGEKFDGQIVTVFSAKGGVGKSTIAVNLAVTLSDGGKRKVCLIDLDLAFGDVGIMLQLSPLKTIADAIPVADRFDETGFRALLTPYRPGLDVLLAPVQPALAEDVRRDLISEVVQIARDNFEYVVIDTASSFSEQMLAALDATHHYILVATPELPALKNLRVTIDMFDLLDYRRQARTVVLNRADTKVGLSNADIERVLRVPVNGWVPSSRDVPVSTNSGVPLAVSHPNHPISVAVRDLANKRIIAARSEEKSSGKKGLFGRSKA
ncbi:pilus assembly protein CpaE [Allocatelliglobosispora scoriae]|uniref:Pilus assembly protein CpaE n=1 Tax=Allocatelliglobosispora scoriae TaxID=643052 RepID=A0A841BW12_9ACTN|nr:P-loop NTPase [Allocatelliglobosispora scoriae]MBB5870952.1 pilus assembly protein CpaE [Allocatelliglobosispora scoriae]